VGAGVVWCGGDGVVVVCTVLDTDKCIFCLCRKIAGYQNKIAGSIP